MVAKKYGDILNGSELAGYIKQSQLRRARSIAGLLGRDPRMAIIQTVDDQVVDSYLRMKQRYGEDVGVDVVVEKITQSTSLHKVKQLNEDDDVDGIVVQLPLDDMSQVDEILDSIKPVKDIDGLGKAATYDSATATAILWLLAGYNINIAGKRIVVVGEGRLVGAPLVKLLRQSGHEPIICDKDTKDLAGEVRQAEVLVSAVGVPGLIKSKWIRPGAIVVDAGVASENGKLIGDVEDAARTRDDIKITPQRGGLGPLTIAVLFDHLLIAATSPLAQE